MKHTTSTDPALREALSCLAQRQPAPPAGMADRFMARLAEQQAGTIKPVPSDAAESPAPPTPRRFTLRRVAWLPAAATAAAAAIAAILWWPGDATVNTPVIMEETEVADVVSTAPSPTLPQPRRVEQELGTRAASPAGALNESPSGVVRARQPALPLPSTSDADAHAKPAPQAIQEAAAPLIAEASAPAQPADIAS
ncbi:MAG: hypothetical protein J6M53_08690, partial [Bacteroidaceae bacterium]|nr:hypothetical protein [Bacteroidaceae bacterium]